MSSLQRGDMILKNNSKGIWTKYVKLAKLVKACDYEDCDKAARSSSEYCVAHGGGKICAEYECKSVAQGSTDYCKKHGGGKRCSINGCKSSSVTTTGDLCIKHGGGKRCANSDCKSSAVRATDYCIFHGGGKRCIADGCITSTAGGSGGFCCKHSSVEFKASRAKKINVRYRDDLDFHILSTIRARIRGALNNNSKTSSSVKLLGCSIQDYRKYIEAKFTEGMSWNNHGKWHIDHIIPCASFDLKDSGQQIKCFNYTNTQPLWAAENLTKSNRIN